MADRIRTAIIVLLIAMAIWLFAEADSLGTDSAIADIRFVNSPSGTPRVQVSDGEWDGRVSIEVRGSNTAIRKFRQIISDVIRFEPGDRGMPPGRGELRVDLLGAIEAYADVREARVQLLSVVPSSCRIIVEDLIEREAPVRIRASEDLALSGSPVITPSTVTITGPQGALDRLVGPDAAVTLELQRGRLDPALPAGVARTVTLPVTLPEAWTSAGLTSATKSVNVEFTVRSTLETETWTDIPVQVVLPSIELDRWHVTINSDDRLIGASLSGPAAALAELKQSGVALLAVLILSSDELEQGVTAKAVTIFARQREDGILVALPEGVAAAPTIPAVSFTATRRESDGE